MRRLMAHALHDRNTPKALAQSRQVIDFNGSLKDFTRFRQIVEDDLAALDESDRPRNWRAMPLEARLEFGFADLAETLPAVSGRVVARAVAVCQRCLEVTELELESEFRYLLVHGKHSGVEDYDVWELDEPSLRPSELVEEVLIMALPLTAAHARPDECGPLARHLDGVPEKASESVRPFADLRALMNEKD